MVALISSNPKDDIESHNKTSRQTATDDACPRRGRPDHQGRPDGAVLDAWEDYLTEERYRVEPDHDSRGPRRLPIDD
jgi:hypothetical protein